MKQFSNKSRLIILLGCFVASISTVVLLKVFSDQWNKKENGFIRLFHSHVTRPEKIIDIGFNSYYVAGAAAGKIYLGNIMVPTKILVTDEWLSTSGQQTLGIKEPVSVGRGAYLVALDSTSIYLFAGSVPGVFRGSLTDLQMDSVRKSVHFISGIPVSPASGIVRTYDPERAQYILEKTQWDHPGSKGPVYLLDRQGDGVFSTDGMLLHEPYSRYVFYIYYHSNNLVCLDTNMNVLYKGRTIDTLSHPQIRLGQIASQGVITLASPAYTVNKHACVAGDRVYVNSRLRANNESESTFDQFSDIDVYSAKDGKYQFSFYLPDYKGNKVSSFGVFGKTLVAVYDHYLHLFRVNS